jgi:predicted kinase
MPTLIHLNGPSGVGKSTLARRYADEHPGVLDLDADVVLSLIGGWRVDFFAAVGPARHLALAMAEAHLRSGHDVVLPQLATSTAEAERFEGAATAARAGYVEVALLVAPEEQISRFRTGEARSGVRRQVARAVDAHGGDELLRKINQDFVSYLAHRPRAARLDTAGARSEASYAALSDLLGSRGT